jgi:hypothetical protein
MTVAIMGATTKKRTSHGYRYICNGNQNDVQESCTAPFDHRNTAAT